MSESELAVVYAALILADDNVPITAEKLNSLITAAGVTTVEPYWAGIFARAFEGKNVKDLLANVGSGAPAAAPAAAAAAPAAAAAAGGAKKEEKKVEKKKEESDDGGDMGFGLFD